MRFRRPAPAVFMLALGCSSAAQREEPQSASEPPAADPPAETSPAGAAGGKQTEGETCGGIAGYGCKPGLYCSFAPGAQCGAADQTGTCQPMGGQICTMEFAPVCGCDETTYPNACHAAREGVSVRGNGECGEQDP